MTIQESIEKYGKDFTDKAVNTMIIETCGQVNAGFVFEKNNVMYDDCIAIKLFTKRRKEVVTRGYRTYRAFWDSEKQQRISQIINCFEIKSKNGDMLYMLAFIDKELIELGYIKKFEQ